MKKVLTEHLPKTISIIAILLTSVFFRYYLHVSTLQFASEFKNQNAKELYSIDTFKIASKLNSLSGTINWICISGSVGKNEKYFIQNIKSDCDTGFLQEKYTIFLPEADYLKIVFTLRLPKEIEFLFLFFIFSQIITLYFLFITTKNAQNIKIESDIKLLNLSKQMFHDIRSPLAALNSLTNDSAEMNENKNALLRLSISKINDIANSLLMTAKNTRLHEFDIIESIQTIIKLKRLEYPQNHFKIQIYNLESCNFLGSKIEFERLISNLINNSIEAKNIHNVEILVIIEVNNTNVSISLSDNGIGISQNIIRSIGEKNISTKADGHGLGLSHAYKTINSWNGKFEIQSQQNIGTKIIMTLPILLREKKTNYVLLDDDELTRMNWEYRAKKSGLTFTSYSNEKTLLNELINYPKNTNFYIDSELLTIKGEDVAKTLFSLGYLNIFMATGHPEENFKELKFLKGVIDKTPPF